MNTIPLPADLSDSLCSDNISDWMDKKMGL
jgi:hypothetical protein